LADALAVPKRFWSAVAERSADTALEKYVRIAGSKAPSTLRSAGALQGAMGWVLLQFEIHWLA